MKNKKKKKTALQISYRELRVFQENMRPTIFSNKKLKEKNKRWKWDGNVD